MTPRTSLSLAAVAMLAGLAAACADQPTAPTGRQVAVDPANLDVSSLRFEEGEDDDNDENGDDNNDVLTCSMAKHEVASKKVGPKGGTIKVGHHSLTVPAGALTQDVTITATQVAGPTVEVQFQPHGLQFAKDTYLKLDFSRCQVPSPRPDMFVSYFSTDAAGLHVTEYLPTAWLGADDEGKPALLGKLRHFSGYTVAYGRKTRR